MAHTLFTIFQNSLSITFFVLSMMLFIEYINVKTHGAFTQKIQKKSWQQILMGTALGVLPGCLGTYTLVTLYSHRLASLGALFAAFVCTMGDEAFFLFSLDLPIAFFITAILIAIAVAGGLIIDLFYKPKMQPVTDDNFEIHAHHDELQHNQHASICENLRNASPHRMLLLFGVALIFILSLFGELGHSHEFLQVGEFEFEHEHSHINWLSVTFMIISLVLAYIISVVSEHFLETHFWNHIIKKHFLKILGWTTVIIAIIHVIDNYVEVQNLVENHQWELLITAILVGLIPESGPHIIFISLYLSGNLPLSILLANSLTQDGHGGLPLFAESKTTFVFLKISKAILAFILGVIGLSFGF